MRAKIDQDWLVFHSQTISIVFSVWWLNEERPFAGSMAIRLSPSCGYRIIDAASGLPERAR